MLAHRVIQLYKEENKLSKVGDVDHLKGWLERTYRKRMNRPLFYAAGKGGGQTYKTLWEVFDSTGNANTPCYYYNENCKAVQTLQYNGHLSLQHWLDDDSLHLRF